MRSKYSCQSHFERIGHFLVHGIGVWYGRQEEEEMQVGLEAAGVNGDQENEIDEQEGPAPELVHHEQERHGARCRGGRCGGG